MIALSGREGIDTLGGHRYRVSKHGLRPRHERVCLFVELTRDHEQPDISEALKRPLAEERDDWEYYHRVEAGVVVGEELPISETLVEPEQETWNSE